MTFNLEDEVRAVTDAYLKTTCLCAGTGWLFIKTTIHGRCFQACHCPAGDRERRANANDRAILHAMDEAAEAREAKERP